MDKKITEYEKKYIAEQVRECDNPLVKSNMAEAMCLTIVEGLRGGGISEHDACEMLLDAFPPTTPEAEAAKMLMFLCDLFGDLDED